MGQVDSIIKRTTRKTKLGGFPDWISVRPMVAKQNLLGEVEKF